MRPADLPLLSATRARAADAAAIADGDISGALMSRAAGHRARTVLDATLRTDREDAA